MNPKVEKYLSDGCMQCKKGGTPDCKIHDWQCELRTLRAYVLDCNLKEDFKWMHPCYTSNGKNIVIIHLFNDYCALLFHKGALLKDPDKILVQQTENVQSVRQLRFSNLQEIQDREQLIKAYILEAIEIEKAGLKVEMKSTQEFDIPEELLEKFNQDASFKVAFESLTPGRQRGYLLHFSQAKQSKTRMSRIEKFKQKILDGKGWNES